MPINIGNFTDIVNSINADIRNALPEVDPTIISSVINALSTSLAARSYDARLLIGQLIVQAFPQSATVEFLDNWAAIAGISRNSATPASGSLVVSGGTLGAVIPRGSNITSSNNIQVTTLNPTEIQRLSVSIESVTRSGNVVSVATNEEHRLASNIEVLISGATQVEYNGKFNITVVGSRRFSYMISTAPVSPATGTILLGFNGARLEVATVGIGKDQNIGPGGAFNFTPALENVGGTAYAGIGGIAGGVDVELDEELRIRTLAEFANIKSLFNSAFIISRARSVPGVTRVFVKETFPQIGDTSVYFMRDGDANPIPIGDNLSNVQAVLQDIRPANMRIEDFHVQAPTPLVVNIQIADIEPNTSFIRENIRAVLQDFFIYQTDFEGNVLSDKLRGAIFNAQDVSTGTFLQDFNLVMPSGDVVVGQEEIAVLGDVSFI